MNLSKEWSDVAQKWWVDWQVVGESVSSIRDTGFCRRGDGCLDIGHQSPSFFLSFFLYVPPRQLEEVAGPLCPTLGSVPFLFFCTSSTSQSDTVPHSVHFSPPLCQSTIVLNESSTVKSIFPNAPISFIRHCTF